MVVGIVVGVVLLLILVSSIVGARRGTPQSFHGPDLETERARIHHQGNGSPGIGGGDGI